MYIYKVMEKLYTLKKTYKHKTMQAHIGTHKRTYSCLSIHSHTHTHTHIHTHIHTRTHTHAHTHTHTSTHIHSYNTSLYNVGLYG